MSNASFGKYVFPQNPALITVENTRRAAVHTILGRGQRVQQTNAVLRKAVLEGELFSSSAQKTATLYSNLREVFEKDRAELLCLPCNQPFFAHFVQLTLKARGDGTTLAYSAAFLEMESAQ